MYSKCNLSPCCQVFRVVLNNDALCVEHHQSQAAGEHLHADPGSSHGTAMAHQRRGLDGLPRAGRGHPLLAAVLRALGTCLHRGTQPHLRDV